MSWSAKRRLIIILLVLLVAGGVGGAYYYFFVRIPVSCSDNIQNQGELGVDCGGPCAKVCESEALPLSVEWVRPFKISPGKYDAAALVVNRNTNFGILKFNYKLTLYDNNNVHVAERSGSIFLNPNEKALVFESGLDTGQRDAVRAFIEYDKAEVSANWVRTGDLSGKPKLSVAMEKVTEGATPTVSADIINDNPVDVGNINVSVVVYDADDNAMAVSTTFIDVLPRNQTQSVVFTWPAPFNSKSKRVDIFPRVNNMI